MTKKSVGWEEGAKWYDQLVGDAGHYYHQQVIVPFLKTWFTEKTGSLVDLGCGQAFFSATLPEGWNYTGIDASKSLIESAKARKVTKCFVHDLTQPLKEGDDSFDVALFLLSLQDMEKPELAIANAAKLVKNQKELWIVINHPCYRIPRQSGWGVDENKKMQYRKIESYMSENLIPIEIHPSKGATKTVFHHHFSLTLLTEWLHKYHFAIEKIEELVSNKSSTGGKSTMENRARKEFPLFMCLKCRLQKK
ncbi:MAG: class I SAM-dependent methyltransferase [Chlamydiia bacterium]